MKKLYTNYLQVDEIGLRNPKDHPDDEEYYQLCIDEPSYKMMGVYLKEDVEKEMQDIILSITEVIQESEDVYHAIKMLEDLRSSIRKSLLKNSANAKTNKDLEVSVSPTPKESQKAIPSLNPYIK